MVVFHAIDVIDMYAQGLTPPLRQAAFLAPILENARPDEPDLYMIAGSAAGQKLFERHLDRAGSQLAAFYRFDPRGMSEPEAALAIDKAVARIVKFLDRFPIVKFPRHTPIIANICS
jgi:hypothetical protein